MTPAQKYRIKHPDRVKESQKKYRERNRDKLRKADKKYRQEHPEKVRENLRKYRENQIECSPKMFLEKKLRRLKSRELTCRTSAKYKFFLCDLNIDILLKMWKTQDGRCALTNKKMTHKFNCLFSVSIDRTDSDKGYVQGNVQLVCQGVNYAKNKFTNAEFLHFWNTEENTWNECQ